MEKPTEEQIDEGVESSMDASDPTTASQPGVTDKPVASSSFDKKNSWLQRAKNRLFNK